MKLKAKIKAKYLDQLIDGSKNLEFSQIENIELTDENGRCVEFPVYDIFKLNGDFRGFIEEIYPDISWNPLYDIYEIRIRENNK